MSDDYRLNINSVLRKLAKLNTIKPGDVPKIKLYMDQVTTFMDEHLSDSKRHEDDKILTKERAISAGSVVLAHTPFTEILSDELISYAAATNVGWMSTLDIHGYGTYSDAFDIACANLRRFIAAGGTVFYSTDLGNGPLPLGINVRELTALQACGMTPLQISESLTSWWETKNDLTSPTRVSFISEISDGSSADFCTWLATARIVETTEVEYL